jgi:hypothetical protein
VQDYEKCGQPSTHLLRSFRNNSYDAKGIRLSVPEKVYTLRCDARLEDDLPTRYTGVDDHRERFFRRE